MPLYEYRCVSCNTMTDIRHGFDEVNTESCPACGGELTKNFNVSGIVFKGSGFYVNDSRSSSSTGSASSSSATAAPATNTPAPAATTPAPANPAPATSGDSSGKAA